MRMKHNVDKLKNWRTYLVSILKKIKENRDLFIYLIFFLIATALWFLNALRKEYVTNISYPIKYSNLPDDYILHGTTDDRLQLKIRAQGYSLLPYYFGKDEAPLFLSVSNFKLKSEGESQFAYVLSREYLNAVSSRLANNIELIEIFPDTLSVSLDKKQRKIVPVKHQSTFTYAAEYYPSGNVDIDPERIEVSGPSSIIDTLKFVELIPKDFANLKDSIDEFVAIRPIKNVILNPEKVNLNLPIEPFTEKKISIPVLAINLPDSLKVRTFPAKINLSCRVPASKFNQIDDVLFHAVIDYDNFTGEGLPDKLKVRLLRQPKWINTVNYSPLFVECLFEKK
ncbi:CdaR family protein [Saccharicrinis aurantiacus]|uniref:CdaR family protein n=1 Tax=Saccharicrinis aurantiacus TaxID=1849719 RepID=UPI0009F95003|nr:YbbR-like domain-containing protein [Saccharicrinis aurantiacus]